MLSAATAGTIEAEPVSVMLSIVTSGTIEPKPTVTTSAESLTIYISQMNGFQTSTVAYSKSASISTASHQFSYETCGDEFESRDAAQAHEQYAIAVMTQKAVNSPASVYCKTNTKNSLAAYR